MNFQVPQFIEVEDKIFGPLTFKQFVYLAGSAGLIYLLFHFLPLFIAIIPIIAIGTFGLALSFYKLNNRPFINVTESAFRYLLTHKLYLWKKVPNVLTGSTVKNPLLGLGAPTKGFAIPKLSESKLKDLAWSLDVNEKLR